MMISNRPELETEARLHFALPYRVIQHLQDEEVPDLEARLQGPGDLAQRVRLIELQGRQSLASPIALRDASVGVVEVERNSRQIKLRRSRQQRQCADG